MAHARRLRMFASLVLLTSVSAALTGCTQAPAAAPTTPPPLGQLMVGPDGIQQLRVGAPVPGSTALVRYGEHTCPSSGGWIPGYPQDALNSGGQELNPFDIVTQGALKSGDITDEFVWSKQIMTTEGIRVGSTLADVEAAYPNARRATSYATTMFVVAGSRGKLIIEVPLHNANAAGEWPQATLGTVVWMHVVSRSAKVASIAGNNDAGPCPVKGKDPGDTDDD